MYSTFNEEKFVFVERFIKPLRNKIYKHLRAVSKNLYFDVLDDIVNIYNNTLHRIIKMKPTDVKLDTYLQYNVDSKEKDARFKVGDHVRISKCKNIFAKGYTPNWSEKILLLAKLKIKFHGHMLLMISKQKKLLELFMKKNCKRLIRKNLGWKK